MPYVIRVRNGVITLNKSDENSPVTIVDLIKLHGIWAEQHGYDRIRVENDEYAQGLRRGAVVLELPTISVIEETSPPRLRIPLLHSKPGIEIGFVNGQHRTDYFWHRGARILPVHATSEESKRNIEHHIGASNDIIAQDLIEQPHSLV